LPGDKVIWSEEPDAYVGSGVSSTPLENPQEDDLTPARTQTASGLQGEQPLVDRITCTKGSRQNRFVTSGSELALRQGYVGPLADDSGAGGPQLGNRQGTASIRFLTP
jgi:hypothetical protein